MKVSNVIEHGATYWQHFHIKVACGFGSTISAADTLDENRPRPSNLIASHCLEFSRSPGYAGKKSDQVSAVCVSVALPKHNVQVERNVIVIYRVMIMRPKGTKYPGRGTMMQTIPLTSIRGQWSTKLKV
jgi:hypothetical protein